MKKILVTFILISVVVGLYSEDNLLWCKKVLFNEPTKHIIQKGDYFSKLSKQYYGTSKYWRELALINRAPNKDLVFPGEEVVIPSLDAIKKLHRTRRLSKVNSIVDDQVEWIIAHHNVSTTPLADRIDNSDQKSVDVQTAAPQQQENLQTQSSSVIRTESSDDNEPVAIASNSEKEKVTESNLFPIVSTIVAIALIVGLMAWYLVRRKKQYEIDSFDAEGQEDEEFDLDEKAEDEDEVDEFVPSFGKRESEEVLVD